MARSPWNSLTWVLGCALISLQVGCREIVPSRRGRESVPQVRLIDLSGRTVKPFEAPKARAIVFVFVSVDCPISNRYAPEIRRLHNRFEGQGINFWLVYPHPDDTADAIRRHLKDYQYSCAVLRDPRHALVKLAKARVTPEAAVFSPEGLLVYHGRIDNRYVDFGKERTAATQFDLQEALVAVVAGKPIRNPATSAVGCYIPEQR